MALFYKNKTLHMGNEDTLESFDLSEISADRTPTFVYDLSAMEQEVFALKKALGERSHLHFAVKANSNPLILRHFAGLGMGADVVSAGEIRFALDAGFAPCDIIFSGVGKTVKEIKFAIECGIGQINVESPQELRRIAEISHQFGKKTPIAFRMNPDVDAKTHPYITTGFKENKFGMDESFIPELLVLMREFSQSLELRGLTIHIGSQLLDNSCFAEAIEKTVPVFQRLVSEGFDLSVFDVGGGVGIDYENGRVDCDRVNDYGQIVQKYLSPLGVEIFSEPGRVITACHGVLLGEVQYVKESPFKKFAILNTGMHHLIRPSLYQAFHRIKHVKQKSGSKSLYDIVGPICESSDFLGKDRQMQNIEQGDILAICEAGAYGRSMASEYNAHAFPEEIVLYKGKVV